MRLTNQIKENVVVNMLTVHLNKDVTLMKELGGGKSAIWCVKYNQMAKELNSESEILVNYVYGQAKRRQNQLVKLGYKLKETIWYNTDELYSSIREVWSR